MPASSKNAPFLSRLVPLLLEVRRETEALCASLSPEDALVQSMADASPTKWHLAHTTWFLETFAVVAADAAYRPFGDAYGYLFNSYYDGVGERHCRARRGLLSRPDLAEVRAYRRHVDARLSEVRFDDDAVGPALVLGMHHEQQHQELILTDIKHAFHQNPLLPIYCPRAPAPAPAEDALPLVWHEVDEGLYAIGHPSTETAQRAGRTHAHIPGLRAGEDCDAFAFDNETPRHSVFLRPFHFASRLVTCGEYQAFIDDGGYTKPSLWLSDGWAAVKRHAWTAPLYWETGKGSLFTLHGVRPIVASEPVCHVSYYEADAFARWMGARLPTEAEWEVAAGGRTHVQADHVLVEGRTFHPRAAARMDQQRPAQMFGDTWQWTSSAYAPYPEFVPFKGVFGEYNGKFMCNQMVLRGGSFATPRSHVRPSYRNFFGPEARWQFTGIRLARNT